MIAFVRADRVRRSIAIIKSWIQLGVRRTLLQSWGRDCSLIMIKRIYMWDLESYPINIIILLILIRMT
jgi:hypothetical protein